MGARITTRILARAFALPSMKVLSDTAKSPAQYFLKNRGKKPAITVVAKAELAQSYMAQDIFCFLSSTLLSLRKFE
jgi:hypothetical protein